MNANCKSAFTCVNLWHEMAENVKISPSVSVVNAGGLTRVATLDWSIAGTLALLVILGFELRVTQLDVSVLLKTR